MKFNIITIFPEMITSYTDAAILGRAQKNNLFAVNAINLRDFTDDKRKTVDDTPYGGGAGMVMKPEPIYQALKSIDAIPFCHDDALTRVKKVFTGDARKKKRTILLSPRGRQFDQRLAEEWSKYSEITFVCGRYEGIDQRVVDHMVDEEVSIGPYVLAGGELGALVIIEAIARQIKGVLGNPESLSEETFNENDKLPIINFQSMTKSKNKNDKLEIGNLPPPGGVPPKAGKLDISKEYPQYTKPADFRGWKVPEVLLSGDHKRIGEWRKKITQN